jgi:MoaA/NifB/PqqE/SkfB family radical SAM enzyme
MKLENIGFYTLSDHRAENISMKSPLYRCELILTDRCNFKCPYCRGLRHKGDLPYKDAERIVNLWASDNLKNIRFSGGEPTLYPHLTDLIKLSKDRGIERIALSTNGSSSTEFYDKLIELGVNDFSISLDACCASSGDIMAGVKGKYDAVISNIRHLSKLTYVTVGIVLNEQNLKEVESIIKVADGLGVSDIRVIPSAQFNQKLKLDVDKTILDKYPILNYRVSNYNNGVHVRGLNETDSHTCHLVLDDMAVLGSKHYPCIIYMREQGRPIGTIDQHSTAYSIREWRHAWMIKTDTHKDPICKNNCLDVCRAFSNKVRNYLKE